MNKTIQSIALTLAIFSPLSLISAISPAGAHHTSAHMSTVSIETSIGRQKKKPSVRNTKRKPTNSVKKSPAVPSTTQPATSIPPQQTIPPTRLPAKPANPTTASPTSNSKIKPFDPNVGNPTAKPGSSRQLPRTEEVVPSIPLPTPGDIPNPAGDAPSVPRTNIPNLPAGTSK